MISPDIIEDIKYRNTIEDVISSYVTLNRSANNLKGLCPFHSEKTPSFTVYTGNDSHFFCYGCGAGGDVVSFIMRIENLDYVSAIEFLAKRAGVILPNNSDFTNNSVSRNRVYAINLEAAKYFRSVLFSEKGIEGQNYFNKRKLSGSVIKHFGLGYAPDSFNSLRDYLKAKGFTEEEMIAADLCQRSKKNNKNVYDVFRHRVMFPIFDLAGNIVAFGGRVLDNETKPKYYNSSDTPAFKKSKNLFALNYAKNHCEECIILCEGYMDVIALHAAGFENAVATLGTAITPDHARIIKKYTNRVIICYDSDEAGQKAADKALKLLSEVDIDARVIVIPGAKDPDEYIKTYGAISFGDVLKESKTKFEYKISKVVAKYDMNDSAQKAQAAKELCREIALVSSSIEREIYISDTSSELNISKDSLKSEVDRIIRINKKNHQKEEHSQLLRTTSEIGNKADPDYAKDIKNVNVERQLIGLLLLRTEYIKKVVEENLVDPSHFSSDLCKRLFNKLVECYNNGGFDFCMLSEDFTMDEVSEAERMIESRRKFSDNGDNILKAIVQKLSEIKEIKSIKENGIDPVALIERRRKKENL